MISHFLESDVRPEKLYGGLLHALLEGNGYPGSIVQMVKMAHLPRHDVGNPIKVYFLYLEYRMDRGE